MNSAESCCASGLQCQLCLRVCHTLLLQHMWNLEQQLLVHQSCSTAASHCTKQCLMATGTQVLSTAMLACMPSACTSGPLSAIPLNAQGLHRPGRSGFALCKTWSHYDLVHVTRGSWGCRWFRGAFQQVEAAGILSIDRATNIPYLLLPTESASLHISGRHDSCLHESPQGVQRFWLWVMTTLRSHTPATFPSVLMLPVQYCWGTSTFAQQGVSLCSCCRHVPRYDLYCIGLMGHTLRI